MFRDVKFALRSLSRAKGLAITVVLTLALGIGANAAIFSVVRGVLLKPLVNRDENHLIYIGQSAEGIGAQNTLFSVPEIEDLRQRVKSFSAIGEFSTIGFTVIGLGEPRQITGGVVDGKYFEVIGLRPVLGRILNSGDDGPSAPGAVVLTYRFWVTSLNGDPSVLGKSIRLESFSGARQATVVGVLEPSIPYPTETQLIANVVTSPHHLDATMVTGRVHRMTEIFGRLTPNASLEVARTELEQLHAGIMKEHPEAYSAKANFAISAVPLRDQVTSRARTILLILLAASGLIFLIACSNVANLILARTVRRESELAVRAAFGASKAALRRTLLAESVLLAGTGAAIGVAFAPAMFSVLAQYAARFSLRALDLTFDSSALWVGVVLALVSAVLLAFVPRLPSSDAAQGNGLVGSSLRITGGTKRRLRIFATIQIAASFVLLAGAGMLLQTLIALQATQPGFQTASILAINIPTIPLGRTTEQISEFYRELKQRVGALAGVEQAALGSSVPWREPGFALAFAVEGKKNANPQDDPRAQIRTVSPGFFAALGVPMVSGRDFNDADSRGAERVVIISASLAKQLFPGQDPLNRQLAWTDPVTKFAGISTEPRRIVGVVADIDDAHITPVPTMTVYQAGDQASHLFVRVGTDPYSIVPAIRRIAHELAPDQPVERAATLEDVRAEFLAPDRLNTVVFGGIAGVALAISIVGVAGVLAFSVSARTREFGVRLAIGSQPERLLRQVLLEGIVMAALGVIAGGLGGYAVARVIGSYVMPLPLPSFIPIIGATAVLIGAATLAASVPAIRASRIDVIQALRME
jgi:predicted permease